MGVPVNIPLLDGNEKKYINECIDTGWISSEGPFVKRFEDEFAKYCGCSNGVAVTNGTVALDIAIKALGIGEGDEVIIPSFTIISCASSVIQAGATPIFVDCDKSTLNINVSKIEEKITPKTKAIMAVHIFGLPVDMDPLLELAKREKLFVIEDAAQAHGIKYKDRVCGSMGDIATFSFYPNKHITTGEGGMLVTKNSDLAERSRGLRNLCFQPERRFVHEGLGTNARMTNLQAALGVAQLEKIEEKLVKKRKMGEHYRDGLKSLACLDLPLSRTNYADNYYWVFGIRLNDSSPLNLSNLMEQLRDRKIGTRPFFFPLHKQPAIEKFSWYKKEYLENSEKAYETGLYIPSGLGTSIEQQDFVIDTLRELLS